MTELKKCCDACEEQLSIYDGSGFICRNVYCECHTTTQPTVRMSEPSLQGTCSKGVCCTIQYGEDAGVCMLDNCSCHTPKKCCRKCEDTPPNHGCYFCYCHTTPTVEPTDCCGKCEPGDSGLHTKCLLPSCECHSPTETGWEERIKSILSEVEFLHGVPVAVPKHQIDAVLSIARLAIAEQKARMVEVVEGMRQKDELGWKDRPFYGTVAARAHVSTYNQAIDAIIKNLKGVE